MHCSYHYNDTNKQVGEDKVAQENEDDCEPLAVRSLVKIFLNLSPTINLKRCHMQLVKFPP